MSKFNVLSPDGFAIHYEDTYPTKKAAKEAMMKWIENYRKQGYYSSVRGRIPLEDVPMYCRIIKVGQEITEGVKMMS